MTQVHCLQLDNLHSQVSVANETVRESGNDNLPRRKVSCTFRSYFTVTGINTHRCHLYKPTCCIVLLNKTEFGKTVKVLVNL